MGDIIIQGSLKAISAPDLLTFINMIKKTGVLQLRQGSLTKQVYWEQGEVVFASSSDPDESLGSFLIRHGKISQDQNQESGWKVTPGTRQGKVLVQMGILTPKELWWAVKNQVLSIIYSLFSWNGGNFLFEETAEPNVEKIKLSVSTTNIIMEGIRRLDEWPRIRELIPSDQLVPILAPQEGRDQSVKFYSKELEILTQVGNGKTIREIIYESDMSEFEAMRLLMAFIMARYLLIPTQAHVVGEDPEDAQALTSLVANYNRVFQEIKRSLGEQMEEANVVALLQRSVQDSSDPHLEGAVFDEKGSMDAQMLTANVADLGAGRRFAALDAALNNLLSFILFEASKHLDGDQKSKIYRMVEERFQQEEMQG